MKIKVTLAIIFALVLAPLDFATADQAHDSRVESQTLVEVCAGMAVIAIGATVVWIIYKHSKCKKGQRCKTCGVLLPKGAKTCPRCFTPVPSPSTNSPTSGTNNMVAAQSSGVLPPEEWYDYENVIQQSNDGSHWTDVATVPDSLSLNGDMETLRFDTEADARAWMNAEGLPGSCVIAVIPVQSHHPQFFRQAVRPLN